MFEPPHLPHSPVSLCVSLSLCVPCGWRPVSECTPLLLSLPILFKHVPLCSKLAAPVPCSPTNRQPLNPTCRSYKPMGMERRATSVSPSYPVNRWRDNASRETGRPSNVPCDRVERAAAGYPACAISRRTPSHRRPATTVPTAASRRSSLMSCQLSVCHAFDTYRRASRDGG